MERGELKRLICAETPAQTAGEFVFLFDPKAGASERAKLQGVLSQAPIADATTGWLCIPTGGSSGAVRFARHDESTFHAAVSGFCLHFGLSRVNAVGVLPLHHVSGLVARVRSAATGGIYLPWEWPDLVKGKWPNLPTTAEGWNISLVPTQLQRLLETAGGKEFLRRFRFIFIGGGPAWSALLETAAKARLPLSLSYGMTETVAMVAAQKEGRFLAGDRDSGAAMPHATLQIIDESAALCSGEDVGSIQVEGGSVFRGYFPELRSARVFAPEDLGLLTRAGTLRVLGRRDGAIITGGEKVWPAEVEGALRSTGRFSDVVVLGVPDREWGQAVTAFYPLYDGEEKRGNRIDLSDVAASLKGALAFYKLPKRLIAVEDWPRNIQGKVNREALLRLVG